MSHRKSGRPGVARAVHAAPANTIQSALAAHSRGDFAGAEAGYRALVSDQPGHVDAHNLLGTLLHQTGRSEAALPHLRRAVELKPDFADAQSNLGMVLLALGRLDEATLAFDAAIALRPGHWNARGMRADAHARQRRWAEARADFEVALQGNPGWTDGWCRLGSACRNLGDVPAALTALRNATAQRPNDADILRDLGVCLREVGHLAESRLVLERAVALAPGQARMSCQLAWTLVEERRFIDARQVFERALQETGPEANRLDALIGLGNVLYQVGLPDEALAALEAARGIDPAAPTLVSPYLSALIYSPDIGKADRFERHREWGARQRIRATPATELRPAPPWRIGFLSADFKNHAVARFLLSWLEHRDRTRFEYFAYVDVAREDNVSGELRRHFDRWQLVRGLDDMALGDAIRRDRPDVLVELSGHTSPNRLAALAAGVSPIQATWLGYPETTGLPSIDYRITDIRCDPVGEDAVATERLARLDGGFLCYAPVGEEALAEISAPARNEFVFGCFNNLAKLNPKVIETFARILREAPGSRLLLKHYALDDPALREWLTARFTHLGVGAPRVVMLPARGSHRAHLECYNEVDLALDSFPYNGTTTTCESLWMGVPVLGLKGERHAGRVGESLLGQVFGPVQARDPASWVADDLDDYVKRALAASRLGPLPLASRRALRRRVETSPLMDGRAFALRLEALFSQWIGERQRGG